MADLFQNPFFPGMTPEQQASMLQMDGEIRSLLPQFHRLLNTGRHSVNAVLAALAVLQSEVIRQCPTERHRELYDATQFALRDSLFGVHSMSLPVAPLVDGGNGKKP